MSFGVFEQNRAQVYAWAYRMLQNHHDALDVTQEVFFRWWRAFRDGSAPANPLGWLRRVTLNVAIDGLRGASWRRERAAAGAAAEVAADEVVRRETNERIVGALASLSERQRSVVVAKVYDGCTFAEIAEQLEVSVPTAKAHYLRALRALRDKLPDLGHRC